MKTCLLTLAVLCSLTLSTVSVPAYAGNCDHSWQTAADGSRCGGRAADQRPGGE
jgi:hypothetical protein